MPSLASTGSRVVYKNGLYPKGRIFEGLQKNVLPALETFPKRTPRLKPCWQGVLATSPRGGGGGVGGETPPSNLQAAKRGGPGRRSLHRSPDPWLLFLRLIPAKTTQGHWLPPSAGTLPLLGTTNTRKHLPQTGALCST